MIAGVLCGAVYGCRGFDSEPAPIMSKELSMAIGAVFFGVFGAAGGGLISCISQLFYPQPPPSDYERNDSASEQSEH